MHTAHGITAKFIMNFNALLNENKDDLITGTIRIANSDRCVKADIEVILVMKTLLTSGITKNEYLSNACRKFFLALLHAHGEYITRKRALSVLDPEGYEEDCLYSAIEKCLGGADG